MVVGDVLGGSPSGGNSFPQRSFPRDYWGAAGWLLGEKIIWSVVMAGRSVLAYHARKLPHIHRRTYIKESYAPLHEVVCLSPIRERNVAPTYKAPSSLL